MKEAITIALPALIHRIGRDAVNRAKLLAKVYHCELKRVRRSRNWALVGDAIDIQSFSTQLKNTQLPAESNTDQNCDKAFRYLTQKIDTALLEHADKLEPLMVKLERLMRTNPNITLSELVHLTGCTLAEARSARFDADTW